MSVRSLLLGIFSIVTLISASAFAGELPNGSYKGHSTLKPDDHLIADTIINNDVMSFIIREDQDNPGTYYAILSEYDRVMFTHVTPTTAITKWVNRMYAYRMEKVSDIQYTLRPLTVFAGNIIARPLAKADLLTLDAAGSLEDAVIIRHDLGTGKAVEMIRIDGKVGSTWEPYVTGKYFLSNDPTGGDYWHDKVNSEVFENGTINMKREDLGINGTFKMTEDLPGMFTMKAVDNSVVGANKIEGRIAVFIDIVNWKPLFTTDELLIIDPDDASNVGFFYEKH